MELLQEKRLFLVRGDDILLFKRNNEYDGDDVNIDEYTNARYLRYVGIKRCEEGVKEVFYYFAKTNDLYITQSGHWTEIQKAIYYPAKPLTSAVLNNYIRIGQYDKEVRVGVKKGDKIEFLIVTD
ncbi:MAG: hypothetical protein IIU14_07265 [Ruminococcus sp.]|nr:hypothetical protein [Ruminococcus sp.]